MESYWHCPRCNFEHGDGAVFPPLGGVQYEELTREQVEKPKVITEFSPHNRVIGKYDEATGEEWIFGPGP